MAKLRIHNHLFFFYHYKCTKVYGVSSKVKDIEGMHYLLFDIDLKHTEEEFDVMNWLRKEYKNYRKTFYYTHNGIHIIVFKAQTWIKTLKEMLECPFIDMSWFALGIRRGYFFLQTYCAVLAHPNVTYMKVDRIA